MLDSQDSPAPDSPAHAGTHRPSPQALKAAAALEGALERASLAPLSPDTVLAPDEGLFLGRAKLTPTGIWVMDGDVDPFRRWLQVKSPVGAVGKSVIYGPGNPLPFDAGLD